MKELDTLKIDLEEKKAIFNEYRIINGPVTKEEALSKISDKKSSIKTGVSFGQRMKNVLFGK